MSNLEDAVVTVRVTYHVARALRSAADRDRRDLIRKAERSGYVPPPGKIDRNKARVATLELGIAAVDHAINVSVAAHREAAGEQG